MSEATALSPAEFEQALRAKGAYYHIYHPFHVAMYEGRATREQIQGWVANRFYYQVNIPLKDAAILANCPDREIRREWIQRLLDHDGAPGEDGGIEAWLRLGEAVGLDPDQLRSQELVLPGVCGRRLRELRPARQLAGSGQQLADRIVRAADPPVTAGQLAAALPMDRPGRLGQARRDVEHGLAITLQHYTTYEGQQRMLEILQFKLDILWSMLDAMSMAYELNRPPYHSVTDQKVWHKGITP